VEKNEQTKKFFIKNDFKVEGILEKDIWLNGMYHDIILFAQIFKERI